MQQFSNQMRVNGVQKPFKNEASPKSLMSRVNFLMSEKGADTKPS